MLSSVDIQELRDQISTMIDETPAECRDCLRYWMLYDLVVAEIERLKGKNLGNADYQTVKVFGACYELQEYAVNELARENEE